jgi:hypothetical protein
MGKTTYLIPVWSTAEHAVKLQEQLINQGVDPSLIIFTKEKKSRAQVLNKYVKDIKTEYIGLCDDDVVISDNAVQVLEDLLDKYPKIGMALAPTFQEKVLIKPTPRISSVAPDEQSLENTSARMWSFNFTLLRRNTGKLGSDIRFDEDYFGSQLIDWDLGLELLHNGYMSVIDHRCAVAHKQTSYDTKSLAYHAVVARSRHIFMKKWQDRDFWFGVEDYNIKHNNEIPTLEEITHASESWLMQYIAKYDGGGLMSCWFSPRFDDDKKSSAYMKSCINVFKENKQIFNPQIIDMNSVPIFK